MSRQRETDMLDMRVGVTLLLLSVVLAGCDQPNVTLQGEAWPFRIWGGDNVQVCEGRLEALQTHYDALSAFMGFETPALERIDVYVLDNLEEVRAVCDSPENNVAGCASGDSIWTAGAWDPHELIHAYAYEMATSLPRTLFAEGLAHTMGCGVEETQWVIRRPADRDEILALLEYAYLPGWPERMMAADLTRYLIDELGWPLYREVYASLGRRDDEATVERRFFEQTGKSFSEWIDQWLKTPVRTLADICLRIAECSWPAPAQGAWAKLECGATWKPGDEQSWNTAFIPVSASSRQRLHLHFDGMYNGLSFVNVCGPPTTFADYPASTDVALGASRIARQLHVWELDPGDFSVAVSDRDSLVSADAIRRYRYELDAPGTSYACGDGAVLDLSEEQTLSYVLPPRGGPNPERVTIEVRSAAAKQLQRQPGGGLQNVWWCESACASVDLCVQLVADYVPLQADYAAVPLAAGAVGAFVVERDPADQAELHVVVEPAP